MFEKVLSFIEARKYAAIRELLAEENVVDIAAIFEELPREDSVRVFRLMSKEMAADTFSYMSRDTRQHIVEAITDQELSGIVDELFLDDTVDFIEEMPASVVKRILANTNREKRALINKFLQYEDDTAGSIMTIEFVDLKKEMTAHDAFVHIRKNGVDKETIYTCYVIDKNRTLEGIVTVKTLLLSDEDAVIEDIMDTNIIFAMTDDDKEEVAGKFNKYDILSLPVVDREKRLVGIVTIDDAINVIQEENTEDFEKMAAITPTDEPYLKTSLFKHAKHRIPWLLILMISATFTGAIISGFEDALRLIPALTASIPMLMNTGGNCGSQASTLVIRGLALGEIKTGDVSKVWWNEISISFIVGLVLACVNCLRMIFLSENDIIMSFVVSISLFAVVLLAQSVGCLLPIISKKIGLDPAVTSTPIITTVVDAGALSIYFSIAKALLRF